QSEHAPDTALTELAVRGLGVEWPELRPPGPDDDLAEATGPLLDPGRRLGREALVVVIVAVDHELRLRVVELGPERPDGRVAAMLAGAEPWVVPDRERAPGGARGEVALQPAALGRAGVAAADLIAVGVEDDHVPVAEVARPPRHAARRGRCAEVVAEGCRAVRLPIGIAGHGQDRPVLEPAPGRRAAGGEG